MEVLPLKSNVVHVDFGRGAVERRKVYDWGAVWDDKFLEAVREVRSEAAEAKKPVCDWDAVWNERFQEGLDELVAEKKARERKSEEVTK